MPYTTGEASDYLNMFQRIRHYLTGGDSVENPVFVNNSADPNKGYLKNLMALSGAVNETWTLTCTTGGGDGVAVFSVSGSSSGAQSSITATDSEGALYTSNNSRVEMTLVAGGDDFTVGDVFTFDTVLNDIPIGQQWTEEKYIAGVAQAGNDGMNVDAGSGATYANELYLQGPGLAGADQVYVQMATIYNDLTDVYNLFFQASAGFDDLQPFEDQPHASGNQYLTASQRNIPYWIVANGRRFIVVLNVESVYVSGYFGLFLPYATPQEYPYPMYIGGCTTSAGTRWSSTSENFRSFFDPYRGYLYRVDNTWLEIQNAYDTSGTETRPTVSNIWPYGENRMASYRESPGGVYPMLPMVIHTSESGGNVYGELEGGYYATGFNASAEDTITVGGTDYILFPDCYRNGRSDYFALKMA